MAQTEAVSSAHVRCIVFGCGAQARYVIDNLRSRGYPLPVALVDLEAGTHVGERVGSVPVSWRYEAALAALDPADCVVIVAHGNNELKLRVAAALDRHGFRFISAVHQTASVSPSARVGRGCIVNAGAALMPDAVLETHVIVHAGSIIEHDCYLEDGVNVAPGVTLAGRVHIGRGAYVYTGSAIAPGVRIGAGAIAGAGAVVLEDVPAGACVVGNPARRLR